jgi:chemotaxis response regulator CheB
MRSAATACGQRVIAVVLSGMLRDGADGAAAVDAAGGAVLVQDPVDAGYPAMPRTALVITITDRPGLEAVACDCYRLIRDEFDELAKGS